MTPKIVTIKLPRNPKHDPRNKVTGPCILSDDCTDSTGEHHSVLVRDELVLEGLKQNFHITRIEEVS